MDLRIVIVLFELHGGISHHLAGCQKLILSFRFFLAPLFVALVAYVESAERDLLKAMYNAAKWPLNDPFEWSPPST